MLDKQREMIHVAYVLNRGPKHIMMPSLSKLRGDDGPVVMLTMVVSPYRGSHPIGSDDPPTDLIVLVWRLMLHSYAAMQVFMQVPPTKNTASPAALRHVASIPVSPNHSSSILRRYVRTSCSKLAAEFRRPRGLH